jgi:hypothetical protein
MKAKPALLGGISTLMYLGLMIAGGSKLTAAFSIPRESTDQAVAYILKYSWSIQLGSFYDLASAIPLASFMMMTIGRLRLLDGGNDRAARRCRHAFVAVHFRADELVSYPTRYR